MISTPIEKVSDTNIFISPNADKTRQLVVYSNFVNNVSQSNAMVLPVPLPHTVKFIDLSNYKTIFDDCKKCFYNPVSTNGTLGMRGIEKSFSNSNSAPPLKVFDVGSYQVSLAMNLDELSNVDTSVFELSSGLKNAMAESYSRPYWGFIICKLNRGSEKYHPMAYSHDIKSGRIHIPTKHYHEMSNGSSESNMGNWSNGDSMKYDPNTIDQSPMFSSYQANHGMGRNREKTHVKGAADDWSHSIYLLNLSKNVAFGHMDSCDEIWDKKVAVDFTKIPDFKFGSSTVFNKMAIHGMHPNVDLEIVV